MKKLTLLVLLTAGCAGPDSDPVEVAERFHAYQVAGDDRAIHALLSADDRAAVPIEAFPGALPPGLAADLLGVAGARLDSATLLSSANDTAAVLLHRPTGELDTLAMVATRVPRGFWRIRLDRVTWRVDKHLSHWARIDSLAAAVRAAGNAGNDDAAAVARAYLAAATAYPDLTRPADMDAARATIRRAEVAEALRVKLRVTETFMGTRLVSGEIENPTDRRIATLQLRVRDRDGHEERLDLWDVEAGATTPVSKMTGLRIGSVTHELAEIQIR